MSIAFDPDNVKSATKNKWNWYHMDDFEKMLEGVFDGVDESEVVDYTKLSTQELLEKRTEIMETLNERGETLRQVTQVGRDLHSTRTAIVLELRRRNIL